MSYWRSHHHVTWAVRGRRRLLMGDRANLAEALIRTKAKELDGIVHAVTVQPDHVHLAISIPPKHAPDRFVGAIKGYSSRVMRQRDPSLEETGFGWQGEFGIISFSQRDFAKIMEYIASQDARHKELRLLDQLERTTEESTGSA